MTQIPTLVLGTARYSSWSMRAWLCVRLAQWPMKIEWVRLAGGGKTQELKERSPNGCVPFIETSDGVLFDSLAIAMICGDRAPNLWPEERARRDWAYCVTSLMHSGFKAFRDLFPMNLGRDRAFSGELPENVLKEIALLDKLFCYGTKEMGMSFLASETMGIADAFYAPMICRLISYHLVDRLSEASQKYVNRIRENALVKEWYEFAKEEPVSWQLERFEARP